MVRSLTNWPDLVRTVARTLTTLTSVEKVGWSGFCVCALGVCAETVSSETESDGKLTPERIHLQLNYLTFDTCPLPTLVLSFAQYLSSTNPLKYRCSIDVT